MSWRAALALLDAIAGVFESATSAVNFLAA
jgi:hypothetical protein